MGQYLPEVRGVFTLIETYKKNLEEEVRGKRQNRSKGPRKSRKPSGGKRQGR
jgi:hypothetical protein